MTKERGSSNPERHRTLDQIIKDYTTPRPDEFNKFAWLPDNHSFVRTHPELARESDDINLRERTKVRESRIFYRRKWLYVLRYATQGLDRPGFDELAQVSPLDPLLVFSLRRQTEYFSNTGKEGPDFVQGGIKSEFTNKFTEEELAPDLLHGETRVNPNSSVQVSKLTALKLVQNQLVDNNGQPLDSITRLNEYLEKHEESVDLELLRNGFSRLISSAQISELIQLGVLTENGLPDFYEACANNMVDLAVDLTFKEKMLVATFPYPTDKLTETHWNLPDLYFLPFLAYGQLKFLLEIPTNIKENTSFSPDDLRLGLSGLKNLIEQVSLRHLQPENDTLEADFEKFQEIFLDAQCHYPDRANDVIFVNQGIREINKSINEVIKVFQTYPGLLNRMKSSYTSTPSIKNYPEWRQELLDQYARAPRKVLRYKFRKEAKR